MASLCVLAGSAECNFLARRMATPPNRGVPYARQGPAASPPGWASMCYRGAQGLGSGSVSNSSFFLLNADGFLRLVYRSKNVVIRDRFL
jgi:hypothetical protein